MQNTVPPEQQLAQIGESYWQRLSERCDLACYQNQHAEIKQVLALSDFVAEQVIRCPDTIEQALNFNPAKATQADFLACLQQQLQAVDDTDTAMQLIRQFRHRHMAAIAWQDLLNKQSISASLQQVSELADAMIIACYHWLYRQLCQRYGTPMGDCGPQPMFIIAMGKLGGKELNFSSDIDLIFTYPEPGEISYGRKSLEHQRFFTKLGQQLISLLDKTTADGRAYRIDMRLRPFGDSGALVSHFASLEDYYQQQGREWERYAMLKGRVINPDGDYYQQLQAILQPFVYRRYLDYSAIQSLRDMKHLIQREVRRRKLDNNIKLGRGGIREIEFIAQCWQLIRGGREPRLQIKGLLPALTAIEQLQLLPADTCGQLRDSYLLLRKVEHCLQQFKDQQTQDLPTTPLEQLRLTRVLNSPSHNALEAAIAAARGVVSGQFALIVGHSPDSRGEQHLQPMSDIWRLSLTCDEAAALLPEPIPAAEKSQVLLVLDGFKRDVDKRVLGARGSDILNQLIPLLLWQAATHVPLHMSSVLQLTLSVIDKILQRTAYLQLLVENAGALQQLVKLAETSQWMVDQIRQFPVLLDELLNPDMFCHPTPPAEFADSLRQTLLRVPQDDLELQMETLRQFKLSQQLRIAAADVSGALSVMQVSDHLTVLAEVLIAATVNMAWQQMTTKYGYPVGASETNQQFAVIAYGKLGGWELGYSSDVDLVFLHQCSTNALTNGDKAIESKQFYLKLSQRIIHLLTTKTLSGDLYEVDMRLRPSGNSGLLVAHIDAFAQYQHQQAWTWEHQALVRSRVIVGQTTMCEHFNQIRASVLTLPRDESSLKRDIREMREKMRAHHSKGRPATIAIKHDLGGIADIEFLVQYWVLRHSAEHPELITWSDNVRILDQLRGLGLIAQSEQLTLSNCYLAYRNLGHRLSLKPLVEGDPSHQFEQQREKIVAIWRAILVT